MSKKSKTFDWPTKDSQFFNVDGKPEYYQMADYLINEVGIKTHGSYIYYYDEGFYKGLSDDSLKALIMKLTNYRAKISHINSFFEIITIKAQIDDIKELESPPEAINLNNGIYFLKDKIKIRHSKDEFFKYKMPVNYEPEAECPKFIEFLGECFLGNQDLVNMIGEIFGYCLLGGDPFLHKAIVFYGSGRNGKSTLLKVLKAVIGESNFSSIPMNKLGDPFSVHQLSGKLANIVGELPTSKIASDDFKTAVGGEEIICSAKYKDQYMLRMEARIIFACNSMPVFHDTTSGMYEKLQMIPFENYIEASDRDPYLFQKLEKELSGILNFSLKGLESLLKRGRLADVAIINEQLAEYRQESDSTYSFFEDNLEVTQFRVEPSERISLKKMYGIYERFCSEQGFRLPLGKTKFRKKIEALLTEKMREKKWFSKKKKGYFFKKYRNNNEFDHLVFITGSFFD